MRQSFIVGAAQCDHLIPRCYI